MKKARQSDEEFVGEENLGRRGTPIAFAASVHLGEKTPQDQEGKRGKGRGGGLTRMCKNRPSLRIKKES